MYKSPLGSINEGINATHQAYKAVACDILGISSVELDQVVMGALQTISITTTLGWQIGGAIGGLEGAALGAAIGAAVGIIIVVGAVTYRFYIKRNDDGQLVAIPQAA
jgi:hypothetical protein